MRAALRASAALCAVATACFHPSAAVNVQCSPDHSCPDGQHCDLPTNTCIVGTATGDSGTPDAPAIVDAPPIDAAIGCLGTGSAGCPAADPVCDTATETCRGCRADVECATNACEESTGTCVDQAGVLYVDSASGSDGSGCTKAAPCATITGAIGLAAASRAFIAIAPGTYAESVTYSGSLALELSGPGSGSVATIAGEIQLIGNPATLLIESLSVTTVGNTCINLQAQATVTTMFADVVGPCSSDAVDARSSLAMRRCQLSGSAAGGVGNGVSIQDGGGVTPSSYDIEQTIIDGFSNDVSTTSSAITLRNDLLLHAGNFAVQLQNSGGGGSGAVVDFVSVIAGSRGVKCSGGALTAHITNSVFAANTGGQAIQPECNASYSIWDDASSPSGTNNLAGQTASFINAAAGNYHLAPGSPGLDAADPASTNFVDLQGAVRPQGSGFDMGAFESP